MIVPFCMTADEVGARGGAPASDLRLRPGPRTGSARRPGAGRCSSDEDVRHPVGLDVRGTDDLADALERAPRAEPCRALRRPQARPRCQRPRERAARPRCRRDATCARRSSSRTRRSTSSSTSRVGRAGRHRRGAHRGRGLPQPERPAADEPGGAGRHHVDARSGARRSAMARPTSDATSRPIPGTRR